jgi:hypothetical protein
VDGDGEVDGESGRTKAGSVRGRGWEGGSSRRREEEVDPLTAAVARPAASAYSSNVTDAFSSRT